MIDVDFLKDLQNYKKQKSSTIDLNFEKYFYASKIKSHLIFGLFENSMNNLTKFVRFSSFKLKFVSIGSIN